MNFGEFLTSLIVIFFMICYFMLLFNVIIDLFRNHEMNGGIKALWIILLLIIPLISLLIYVIVYGRGMAQRGAKAAQQAQEAQAEYVRGIAGTNPAEQIAKAQELLAAGTITQAEFDALKAKALA